MAETWEFLYNKHSSSCEEERLTHVDKTSGFPKTLRGMSASPLAGRSGILTIAGMAALWLCLQASGYYPLSLLDAAGDWVPQSIARYHLLYGCLLVTMALIATALGRRYNRLFQRLPVILAGGAAGIVGHGVLAGVPLSAADAPFIVGAIVLVAAFITITVIFWGCTLVQRPSHEALLVIPLSFLVAQAVLALFSLLGLSQNVLLIACAAATTACAAGQLDTCPASPDPKAPKKGLLRSLPWGMLAPMLFLIYFCEIFIRLRISAYAGSAAPERQAVTAVIAFATFVLVLAIPRLTRIKNSDKNLVIAFAVLMVVYLIALIIMLLFNADEGHITNRILVACSHCNEVFLWMVLVPALRRSGHSPIVAFALLIIFALAIPWALSFDLYYLSGLDALLAERDILSYGIGLALAIAATGTVGFLLVYALRSTESPETTSSPGSFGPLSAERAFEPFGLTPRELEVAGYLARGYSAKKIAEEMFLSEASIRAHTMHIYRKMDIHSKQELISYINAL